MPVRSTSGDPASRELKGFRQVRSVAEAPESTESAPTEARGRAGEGQPDRFGRRFRVVVTFRRMEAVSLFHSLVYVGLLVSAFVLGGPEPFTFVLGLSHGLLWIGMAITSFFAVRYRVINLRLATAIVLLGCIAPFFGTIEFLRQSRRRGGEVV